MLFPKCHYYNIVMCYKVVANTMSKQSRSKDQRNALPIPAQKYKAPQSGAKYRNFFCTTLLK